MKRLSKTSCVFALAAIGIVGILIGVVSLSATSNTEGSSPLALDFFKHDELTDFLANDNTDKERLELCGDYARQLLMRAEDEGYRLFQVAVFPSSGNGHALNATFTQERLNNGISTRLVWIEPQTDEVFEPMNIGDNYDLLVEKNGWSIIIEKIYIFELHYEGVN